MIYIRMELWHRGNRATAEVLGEGLIVNDGTGTRARGNYDVMLSKRGGFGKGSVLQRAEVTNVLRRVRVEGFARTQLVAWPLLGMALEAFAR